MNVFYVRCCATDCCFFLLQNNPRWGRLQRSRRPFSLLPLSRFGPSSSNFTINPLTNFWYVHGFREQSKLLQRVPLQRKGWTRKLCYRKDDRAMRCIYRCPENFRESLSTPVATFPDIFNGLFPANNFTSSQRSKNVAVMLRERFPWTFIERTFVDAAKRSLNVRR